MVRVGEVARSVRSKNAGPFWVTVDIFFSKKRDFEHASAWLDSEVVASSLCVEVSALKRFDLPDIFVIKFSFPRSVVQGSRFDRDMHGAQYANIVAALSLPDIQSGKIVGRLTNKSARYVRYEKFDSRTPCAYTTGTGDCNCEKLVIGLSNHPGSQRIFFESPVCADVVRSENYALKFRCNLSLYRLRYQTGITKWHRRNMIRVTDLAR